MRHPKLPKKIYNRWIINLGNLFVQKCDEVKRISVCKSILCFAEAFLVIATVVFVDAVDESLETRVVNDHILC